MMTASVARVWFSTMRWRRKSPRAPYDPQASVLDSVRHYRGELLLVAG